MRLLSGHYLHWWLIAVAILVFAAAGLMGGPDFGRDVAAIYALAGERAAHIGLTGRAIVITEIGGAPGMMTILAIAVSLLAFSRRWRDAVTLSAIVLGGRVGVAGLGQAPGDVVFQHQRGLRILDAGCGTGRDGERRVSGSEDCGVDGGVVDLGRVDSLGVGGAGEWFATLASVLAVLAVGGALARLDGCFIGTIHAFWANNHASAT